MLNAVAVTLGLLALIAGMSAVFIALLPGHHPDATADPVDVAFRTAPVDPASQTQVYESHRRACPEQWDDEVGCSWPGGHACVRRPADAVHREVGPHSVHYCRCGSMVVEAVPTARPAFDGVMGGCTCPPGPEDDHLPGCAWFGVVLDPTPTQREIAVGEVMGGVCCGMHYHTCEPPSELCCLGCTEAMHDTFPIPHADGSTCVLALGPIHDCVCAGCRPQPPIEEDPVAIRLGIVPAPTAEVAPGAVKHGRNRPHRKCVLALIDRRPEDVCASCAPTLVGAREITGRPTARGTS